MYTRLKTFSFVFLIILVYPKSSKVANCINSEYIVGVAVKQLNNSLLKVSDGAHFKVELFVDTRNVLVQAHSCATNVALLPSLELVPLVKEQLLGQVSPEEIVFRHKFTIAARLVKGDQVVGSEEFKNFLKRRSDHYLKKH